MTDRLLSDAHIIVTTHAHAQVSYGRAFSRRNAAMHSLWKVVPSRLSIRWQFINELLDTVTQQLGSV